MSYDKSKSKKSVKKGKEKEVSKLSYKKNKDSDSESNSDNENDEMDVHEYRKFLQKIFPSKHLDNKIKSGEKVKQIVKNELSKDMKDTKNKKKQESSSSESYETEDDDDDEDYSESSEEDESGESEEEESEEDEKSEESEKKKESTKNEKKEGNKKETEEVKGKKLNIILTIGGSKAEEEEEEEWEDYDSEYEDSDSEETENEDDPISDSEEEIEIKKNGENTKVKPEIIEENHEGLLVKLKDLYEVHKSKTVQKCIDDCEQNIKKEKEKKEKKDQKYRDRNSRIFKKIIKDKNTMNDAAFFEKLEFENQKKIIKELKEINKISRIEKPYRITLLESDIPTTFKSAAIKKINSIRYMEPGSGEYYKIKNWVDTFMRIPFNKYNSLPVNIDDGIEKCHDFMENAQKILNEAVYGLNDAKMQIMQMLGQLIINPKSIGTAIAIHGAPGTGKTSLVKEGISKILNRPFAFIALGGATDSSFLEGHSYTYEGSTWGKILQILIDSKCMNPVIYFDELDKISDTPRGEEIAGILTHLTDTSQNSQFHDKYFSEIEFDLSKCLFIFSYNDESKINPILKDRMYRIQTKGYTPKQKTVISNNYLLPKIHEQVKFNKDEIIIPDDALNYIIENYCNKEEGVRNLKRCLEIIYTKINLYRLMKPGSNLFEEDMSLKVEFPFKVTKDIVDKLIKKNQNTSILHGLYI